MSPQEQRRRQQALEVRGRAIQTEWNRRLHAGAPGVSPKTRGIGPADQAEARANIARRRAERDAYLVQIRREAEERQRRAEKEAQIEAKVQQYRAQLRQKAGLVDR